MLVVHIPESERFDEATNEFIYVKETNIQLEHSLVSLSKWESKWHKPFFHPTMTKTNEETLDYIRCMTITQNVKPETYYALTKENITQIQQYIDDPMTATTFSNHQIGPPNREIITAELIYYWMISYNVPVEFEKWHLNKLLALIHVLSIKNDKPKKMSKKAIMSRNAALNAARRQQYNTKG